MPRRKKKNYRPLTPEQRAERVERDRKRMQAAVDALRSSEGWQRWLAVRKRFRSYSFRNQLLIALQRPDATRVAGFVEWTKIGYSVRKGEGSRPIFIYAPCPPSKKRMRRWREEGADPQTEPRTFFKIVRVYDRAQVHPLPDFPGGPLQLDPPPPEPISGDGLAHLFEPLAALAAEHGYDVRVAEIDGTAEALCEHDQRRITVEPISPERPANRQIARLIHEDAHMLIRAAKEEGDPVLRRGEEEAVVECVAAIVCAGAGLDVTGSSAPYIAGWGEGDDIERYAQLIDRLAWRIEATIDTAARKTRSRGRPRKCELVPAAA